MKAWQSSWISDRKDFSYFDLQVVPILPTNFWVSWPFCSGEEVQNTFSRWQLYWITYQNDFSYFWFTSCSETSYQVSSQLAIPFRRSSKWIFKMATTAADQNDFSYLLSQAAPILPTKFPSPLAFWFRSSKYIFKMAAILDLWFEWF